MDTFVVRVFRPAADEPSEHPDGLHGTVLDVRTGLVVTFTSSAELTHLLAAGQPAAGT